LVVSGWWLQGDFQGIRLVHCLPSGSGSRCFKVKYNFNLVHIDPADLRVK